MQPYQIVGEVKRFDRRKDAFSRSRSDPASEAFGKKPRSPEEAAASGKPGYGLEDRALHAAARVPDRVLRQQWKEQAAGASGIRYEPDDWNQFTGRVKDAARFYGASMVGVTRVNPLWLYARGDDGGPLDLPEGVDTAIVMAIEMDCELISLSPAFPASAATGKGYSQMAFAATCLARYLLELGWRAIPSGNDTALSIPLAIDVGLGELGRSGSLITKPYGPRVRLCKVFTDAPLTSDKPISFGVEQTCRRCRKCVDACPAGAIPDGGMTDSGPTPSNNPGVLKWYVNPDKCLAFWSVNGTSCANCISSCPFSGPSAPTGPRGRS